MLLFTKKHCCGFIHQRIKQQQKKEGGKDGEKKDGGFFVWDLF